MAIGYAIEICNTSCAEWRRYKAYPTITQAWAELLWQLLSAKIRHPFTKLNFKTRIVKI